MWWRYEKNGIFFLLKFNNIRLIVESGNVLEDFFKRQLEGMSFSMLKILQ